MKSYEAQLANDFARLSDVEIFKRYWGKIEDGTTIRGLVDALESLNLLTALVRTDWRNDGRDQDGLYLIRDGQLFQVFQGERGIKNWLKEFHDLKSACTAFVDSALNQLDYLAPDSKIG